MDSILLPGTEKDKLDAMLNRLAGLLEGKKGEDVERLQAAIASGCHNDILTRLAGLEESFAALAEQQFNSFVVLDTIDGFEDDLNLCVKDVARILNEHLWKVYYWATEMREPLYHADTYSDEEVALWKALRQGNAKPIQLANEISAGELGLLCGSYLRSCYAYDCEQERREFLRSRQIVIEEGDERMFKELWSTLHQLLLITHLYLPEVAA